MLHVLQFIQSYLKVHFDHLPTMLHVLRFVHSDRYLDLEVVLTVFGGVHAVPLWLTATAGGHWNHHLQRSQTFYSTYSLHVH